MTTTYGRVGAKGQDTTRKYPSAAKAKDAAAKLIKQKIGKGYSKASTKEKAKAGKLEEAFHAEVQKLIADDACNEYVTNNYRKKFIGLAQPSELARASGYRNWRQRMAIARNPVTPTATLGKLSADSNQNVAAQARVTISNCTN